MINKDYLKLIFQDKKKLLKLANLRVVKVPKYDELSVKQVWPKMQAQEDLMLYFPDPLPDEKEREPDRTYMFNILNTLRPEYTKKLMATA